MDKYDVVPFWINLEITETATVEDSDMIVRNIGKFHNMGVTFSLDDYGSGFASADYLFKLPVEIVKIDKGILWNAMKDNNAKIVLINTLKMLKELGKKIVVEGVEDADMVKLLEENGCDYMQGYFYSKPIPPYEFVEFLKELGSTYLTDINSHVETKKMDEQSLPPFLNENFKKQLLEQKFMITGLKHLYQKFGN